MPLIFTGIPEGHTQHESWVAGGRPSLKDLPTAKAGDMEFPYMELVKGSSRTDEILLSAWCKANGFPIEYFDWTDAELTKAYFEAHPEEIPATMSEQAELVARTITSDDGPRIVEDVAANLAAAESGNLPAMKVGGRVKGAEAHAARAERGKAMAAESSDRDARGDAYKSTFEREFAKHKAGGHSDARAKMYAERTASTAADKA